MNTPEFAHIIDGEEIPIGRVTDEAVTAIDPYSGDEIWRADPAGEQLVGRAIESARRAQLEWTRLGFDRRRDIVERFTIQVKERSDELAEIIAAEAGKPLWESRIEVNAVVTKFAASVEAYEDRASEMTREVRGAISKTRYLPHGVMVVLSPFNFPASMGNSHVMPALLAGNTVVLKPSELTPMTGLLLAQIWQSAGLPAGVLNCLSGGAETGRLLVEHPGHDGVLFVGGHTAATRILRTLADQPERIVALEVGGNSPLVIWDYDDIEPVLHLIIQSTFVSAGQRCTAARRLFVRHGEDALVGALSDRLKLITRGHYQQTPEPFYGPLIRRSHADLIVERVDDLVHGGASAILVGDRTGPSKTVLGPTLLDMTNCQNDQDEEIFGPVLKIYKYQTLDEAIDAANDTRFGLAAGIVCRDRAIFEEFFTRVRAGIINWNQQLTGATTFAPFGGIKQSGNFRSAGYHSVDYCSYPVASFEVMAPRIPESVNPGLPF